MYGPDSCIVSGFQDDHSYTFYHVPSVYIIGSSTFLACYQLKVENSHLIIMHNYVVSSMSKYHIGLLQQRELLDHHPLGMYKLNDHLHYVTLKYNNITYQ